MILPNLDMMIINLDFEAYETVFADLIQELHIKKMQAKKQMQDSNNHLSLIDINGIRFQVYPNGTRGYSYILHGELLKLEIARYQNKNNYPVRVMFHSAYLWSAGPQKAWEEFSLWISSIAPISRSQVSRVDLCTHTDEISFANKLQHFKGHYTKDTLHREHRRVEGISFGSRESKIFLRIYDKENELKKSRKDWFREVWEKNGAQGTVWNIEFELKRDFFNEVQFNDRKVETVEDLFQALPSIWHYLTEEHIILTNKDRSRVKRSTINEAWLRIQSAYDHFGNRGYIERRKIINHEADALIPQMAGCVTSYIAKQRTGVIDIEDILTELAVAIPKHYHYNHKKSVEEVMQEKYMILQEVLGDAYFTSTTDIPG